MTDDRTRALEEARRLWDELADSDYDDEFAPERIADRILAAEKRGREGLQEAARHANAGEKHPVLALHAVLTAIGLRTPVPGTEDKP